MNKKGGRPRLELDIALVRHLIDDEGLGWTLAAQKYREITGLWVSRDTIRRRYLEPVKKSWQEEFREELNEFLKNGGKYNNGS